MKSALCYEVPVARPWAPGTERAAMRDRVEQAGREPVTLGIEHLGRHAMPELDRKGTA